MEGDTGDPPPAKGNKLFRLLNSVPHLFVDLSRRVDPDTFNILKSTCAEFEQNCALAEKYVTREINSLQLENKEIKMFVHFGSPASPELEHSQFKFKISSIRFINNCTDEDLDKIISYFGTRSVTAKEFYPGTITCSLDKLRAFIKKYAIEELVITGDIPSALCQDPIMQQVKELMLNSYIGSDPTFLLSSILNRCQIVFKQFPPNWIIRQILEQLIENKRQLDFWKLGPYSPDNLKTLFDGWKTVSPWDEESETERPLIVKHDDLDWTVVCRDHAAYTVKYENPHLIIEERNEFEEMLDMSDLHEDFNDYDQDYDNYDVEEDYEENYAYENDDYDFN